MTRRGWILFIVLGLLWGMPYLLIRIAVGTIDPLVVAGSRTLIGALLLLPVALHRNALGAAFRHWKWLLAFTVIEMSVPWVLLGHAETRLTSSTAGLLIAVVPLFAAGIISRLGHERLESRRLLGLGVGFAGVALLVGLDIHFSDLPAVLATIVVALCYAIGPIIIDRSSRSPHRCDHCVADSGDSYLSALRALWPTEFTAAPSGRWWPRRAVHRRRVHHLLCPDCGSRTGAGYGDHLCESRRGYRARRAGAQRAADNGDDDWLSAGDPGFVPRNHAASPRESRNTVESHV
jgi:drug/metabolite transporter (DMT)-like permease